MSSQDQENPYGHYQTAGYAVIGMGLMSATLFVVTLVVEVDLGFIDGTGILGIGIAFLLVGMLMTSTPADA